MDLTAIFRRSQRVACSFGREYDARTRLRIGFRGMVTQWNSKVAADVWQRGWVDSPLRADLWVANYYSARNPLILSSLVILGVVARMFRCATRSSCWCT